MIGKDDYTSKVMTLRIFSDSENFKKLLDTLCCKTRLYKACIRSVMCYDAEC